LGVVAPTIQSDFPRVEMGPLRLLKPRQW
jgi:hypothetical protein